MRPEVLWCSSQRKGAGNGWKYPPAVERQLRADFDGKRILQLFGGRSNWGVRMDVDPLVRPEVLGDAWLPPFAQNSFDVVILDPPYVHLNAQTKTALFRAAGWIAREHVVWFNTWWVSASSGLTADRAWLIRVGDNCYIRCLQYFRVTSQPGPVKYFKRGPAMKYNRWLAQPNSLGLIDASE